MRLFRILLRLFPKDFQSDFGAEMKEVFRAERAEIGERGRLLDFWRRTVAGVFREAPRAHFENLLRDSRHAVRAFAANPLFFLTASISLAIGIGATTTVFSIFGATFLHVIPGVQQPDRLVNVKWESSSEESDLVSYPDYRELRDSDALQGLAGFNGRVVGLSVGKEAELAGAQVVTTNYFEVLGLEPARGRLFRPEEDDRAGAAPRAVVSDWFWRNRLGGDPDVVGREISVNARPFTIIGVMPPGFRGPFIGFNFDLFVPVAMSEAIGLPSLEDRTAHWIELVGRLRQGVSARQSQAAFDLEARRLAMSYPERNEGLRLRVEANNGFDADVGDGLLVLLVVLMGVSALVLVIACVNVANMVLSRLADRSSEMALRLALGAGGGRLTRQLLTENILLALFAGSLGTGLAYYATAMMSSVLPSFDGFISLVVALDARALLWALAASLLSAVFFGLVPALRASRSDWATALREGGARMTRKEGVRNVLVAAQVALSLVVLVCAGLFLRALGHAGSVDIGFRSDGVMMGSFDTALIRKSASESMDLFRDLIEQVENLPGVDSASMASRVPLSLGSRIFADTVPLEIAGHRPPVGQDAFRIEHSYVSERYFDTLRISLVEGRFFGRFDRLGAPAVGIVNQALAERFWTVETAVGKHLRQDGERIEIVGVVRDNKYRSLNESPQPFLYLPFQQTLRNRGTLLVRSERGMSEFAQVLRERIREVVPHLPIQEYRPLEEHLAVSLLPQRIAGAAAGIMGAIALVLSSIGLYGVVAYSVSRRGHEIGIRIALGAGKRDIVQLILKRGLVLAWTGVLIGLGAAIAVSRFLESFLIGLSPTDIPTFLSVTALLVSIAALAGYLPARRAARTDPIRVLKSQ